MAVSPRIVENSGEGEDAPCMKDETTTDPRRCFRCGRDLGPLLERKKMDTESGPICFVCFNEAAADDRGREPRR